MKRSPAATVLIGLLVAGMAVCAASPIPARAAPPGIPVSAPGLEELSGLVAAPDGTSLWAIEDSGNDPLVRAVGPDGAAIGEWSVWGAENRDWEDLAIILGPDGARQLLIADIGDNEAKRDWITLYLTPEPDPAWPGWDLPVSRIDLAYPDGPRDAEAILVHPQTGEIIIVTKVSWGAANAYRIVWSETPALELAMRINGPGIGPFGSITGGAVAPDGSKAALLTYGGIVEWTIAPGQTLEDALRASPRSLPRPSLGQTEAIAYSADGSTLYVTAEGKPSVIAALPLDPER